MSHRDRERRKPRLDIDTGAIPAKKGVDRVGVPQIVRAWNAPRRCADLGHPEEANLQFDEAVELYEREEHTLDISVIQRLREAI